VKRSPLLGEHTTEVLKELGVTESEMAALKAANVI
jgi:crotonobetainyl-CoA:carnitine CoA-transferase CaiB-like acyl-CoA transferase